MRLECPPCPPSAFQMIVPEYVTRALQNNVDCSLSDPDAIYGKLRRRFEKVCYFHQQKMLKRSRKSDSCVHGMVTCQAEKLSAFHLTHKQARRLLFCTLERPAKLRRDSDIFIECVETGDTIVFAHVRNSTKYISKIRETIRFTGDPVLSAAYVMAELILSHPFDDGNGRLARSVANATLVGARATPYPVPLDLAIASHYNLFCLALRSLSATANWSRYFQYFCWMLYHTCDEISHSSS